MLLKVASVHDLCVIQNSRKCNQSIVAEYRLVVAWNRNRGRRKQEECRRGHKEIFGNDVSVHCLDGYIHTSA